MGVPVSMAKRKAPSLNLRTSPSVLRVPSGKIITLTRLDNRSLHESIAATTDSRLPRISLMSPAMRINQPTSGYLKKSSLESHFISQGNCEINNMSTKLLWLATTMYGRRGSEILTPDVLKRHNGLSH